MPEQKKSQADKFKEAARKHDADEDEKRWEERLKKVAKHKATEATEIDDEAGLPERRLAQVASRRLTRKRFRRPYFVQPSYC